MSFARKGKRKHALVDQSVVSAEVFAWNRQVANVAVSVPADGDPKKAEVIFVGDHSPNAIYLWEQLKQEAAKRDTLVFFEAVPFNRRLQDVNVNERPPTPRFGVVPFVSDSDDEQVTLEIAK